MTAAIAPFTATSIGIGLACLREHFPAEQHAKALIDLGDISFITRDEARSYKEMDAPRQQVKPRRSNDLKALTVLAYDTGAKYLNYWQEGQWHTLQMSGPRL